MINLLPPIQKEEVSQQKRLRLSLILGIVFLSFFISLFLVLFILKIYTSVEIQTNEILIEEGEETISSHKELEKEIRESNTLLAELSSFYDESVDISGVLSRVIESLPIGTYLKSFSFDFLRSSTKKKPVVNITGYCQNRNALSKFQKSLEDNKDFYEILFTTESWLHPEEFSVSFQLEQKK